MMKPNDGKPTNARRLAVLIGSLTLALNGVWAQETPAPSASNTTEAAEAARKKAAEARATEAEAAKAAEVKPAPAPATAPAPEATDEDLVTLDIFNVTAAEDEGYRASQTMSGTRLNSKIEDLPASITVITKEQMMDTAAVDINDLFLYEGNTEGTGQFTSFTIDRGFTVDNVAQTPNSANRVRGMGAANVANGAFATTGTVPIDSYNLSGVEISRGPNSNIFGLGDASGTVNLIAARANLMKESSQVVARVDSYGGYRGSFDLNRPIIKDKLAVRLLGVYEQVGFERKPSFDKTNRYTFAFTAKPWDTTTLSGSYEIYANGASRPNSTTPRDIYTEWTAAGRPVWNPVTYSWRYLNSTTYHQVTQAQEATMLPWGINPEFSNLWNRPSWYIDEGEVQLYTVNRMPAATGTTGAMNFPNFAGQERTQQAGTLVQRSGGTLIMPDGSSQTFVPMPLFQQVGVTDKSIYDWTETNFAAPNFTKKDAGILKLELEHWFLRTRRHILGLQVGYFDESVDRMSRSFVGASDGAPPVVRIDIDEVLLDGRPNPYFLRPYLAASEAQIFRYPEENTTARYTLGYQLDLTGEDGWLRWLGRHRFAGYGEQRELIMVPNGHRSRDQIVSDEPWMTAGNLTNVPGRGAETKTFTRYYMGGAITDGGRVVDYAPKRLKEPLGTKTLYYMNRNLPAGSQWVSDDVEFGNVHFSTQNLQLRKIKTNGIVWQGYLWDDRIIPTMGIRNDSPWTKNADADVVTDPGRNIFVPSYTFNNNAWIKNDGQTKTMGIVVKPFSWLSVHYNKADSFLPETLAYDLFQRELANPQGDGEDYGFTLNLFNGKLFARFNKYETVMDNARNGSTNVINSRVVRLDMAYTQVLTPEEVGTDGDRTNIQRAAWFYLTSVHPDWTPQQKVDDIWARFMNAPGDSDSFVTREYVDWVQNQGIVLADVNTVTSKGTEVEINYNPDAFFTLKGTITQAEAIDTDISPNIQQYIDARWDHWTTLRYPTDAPTGDPAVAVRPAYEGQLWWTANNGGIPRDFYYGNVNAPYKLAVANAGKPRTQTREWRVNLTTRYRLAGLGTDNFLKNVTVGGAVRWEDQASIGYYGLDTNEPDGAIREYDPSRPIYDDSHYYVDLWAGYSFRLMGDKVRCNVQLNVRNVNESGRLQGVSTNPDGSIWNYRIIDPRQFILTTTFDF